LSDRLLQVGWCDAQQATSEMPPTLLLIRHAEALHNKTRDHNLRDPGLTLAGFEQCVALRGRLQQELQQLPAVDLIVVSPMRRTLQTALTALDWLIIQDVKVEADADWQEVYDKPCDTGSPLSEISGDFPRFDFSKVDPVYPNKSSPESERYAPYKSRVLARAQFALEKLYRRPEKLIIVVSHSSFMRLAVTGTQFANADFRVFDFAERHGDNVPYRLVEWETTRLNGGGMGLSPKAQVELGSGDLPPDVGSAEAES
jgi:broad specificity phosphatase PhoE